MIRLGILGRASMPVAALSTLTASSWSWLADLRHPATDSATPLVDLIAAGSAWALHAGLVWLLLITLAVVAEALSAQRPSHSPARWSRGLGCPPALRRAVLVGCGLSVLVCAAPATAATADPVGPMDLTGLVLPDRPVATSGAGDAAGHSMRPSSAPAPTTMTVAPDVPSTPSSTSAQTPDQGASEKAAPPSRVTIPRATPAEPSRQTARPTPEEAAPASAASHRGTAPDEHTVVVRSGDTLWSLAADRLAEPSDAAVAAEVARWSAANVDTVDDPDLIHPGQHLTAPASTDHEENR